MSSFLLVFLGGGLGAVARYGLGLVMQKGVLAIFSANLIGSFLMGLAMGWLMARTQAEGNTVWLFLCVGVFGGFTTFSSFSLQAVHMLREGQIGQASVYVGGSVVGALGLLFVGLAIGRKVFVT